MTEDVKDELETTGTKTYHLTKNYRYNGVVFAILGLFLIGVGLFILGIFIEEGMYFDEFFLWILPLIFFAVGVSIIFPSIDFHRESKKIFESGDPIITLTPQTITFHSWIIGKSGTYEIEDLQHIKQRYGKRLAIKSKGDEADGNYIGFLKKQLLSRAKIRKGKTSFIVRGTIDPGPMALKQDIIDMWGEDVKKHHSADAWDIFTEVLDALPG